MSNVAKVFYFLALRNGFSSFLQIDNKDATVLEQVELDNTFEQINCVNKKRIVFDESAATENSSLHQMIFVTGKNMKQQQLQQRIEFAEQRLAKNGVLIFDYANPTAKVQGEAWQCVARLRCRENAFICVIADVAHGCAVYRPHQSSLTFAKQHIPQYDALEYVKTNRAALLNIVTWEQFDLLSRFF